MGPLQWLQAQVCYQVTYNNQPKTNTTVLLAMEATGLSVLTHLIICMRQAFDNEVAGGSGARQQVHDFENPNDNNFGFDGNGAFRSEPSRFRWAFDNDVAGGARARQPAYNFVNPHDNNLGFDGNGAFQGNLSRFRQEIGNEVAGGSRPLQAHDFENPNDNNFGFDGNGGFRSKPSRFRWAFDNNVAGGSRACQPAHSFVHPYDNDFGVDGNGAFHADPFRFNRAIGNGVAGGHQHAHDFGRTARVVNIVEVPESNQRLAIGWKEDQPRTRITASEPLRRSARRAAAAAAAGSSKEADINTNVQSGQKCEVSSRGNRPQSRQAHNLVAEQQDDSSDDDVLPKNSRENNESNSDTSQRDDLGRWMDGEDELSSDFEPKVKISKANQEKKVNALKKRKNNAHQFDSDEEAGPSKKPTTAGRGKSDSDSDFETEARSKQQQQKKAPLKSKAKQSLSLQTKATGEVRRKGNKQKQQQAEPKFTAGAPHEADNVSVIFDREVSEAITISDSEKSVGHPAAELFPIVADVQTTDFIIPLNSLSESWCTICFEDYDKESFVGILSPCHCCKFCYVCAVRISESLDPSCPRCRVEIVKVTSQPFTESVLADDFF